MSDLDCGKPELLEEARRLLHEAGADADMLYRRWFHRETGKRRDWPAPGAYRAAALDPKRFEGGWQVVAEANGAAGAVVVTRGGRERIVAPPEMAPDDPQCLAPGPGALLQV